MSTTTVANPRVCRCGEPKGFGVPVCPACRSKLPEELKVTLWSTTGEEYERAYTEACRTLDALAPKEFDREAWLAERRKQLGASEIACILGVSPFAGPWEVWADKMGLTEPWEGNKATELGQVLERSVLDAAEQKVGKLLRNVRHVHSSLPIAATFDALTCAEGIPVEAKTSGIAGPIYGDWGEAMTDQIPDYYLCQVHGELLVSEAEVAWMFALLPGRGIVQFQIDRHDSLLRNLGAYCADWWDRHITRGKEPPREPLPALEAVKRLRRQPAKSVRLSKEGEAQLARRERLKRLAKTIEDAIEATETKLLLEMGDAEAAEFTGGTLTYFETCRKSYVVKESKFRSFRTRKAKDK